MCVLLDSLGARVFSIQKKAFAITLNGIKTVTIDCNIGQYDGYCSADDEEISTDPADIIADLKDRNPRKKAFEKSIRR